MNDILSPQEVRELQAENARLRAALAELERTLVWVQEQLKGLA